MNEFNAEEVQERLRKIYAYWSSLGLPFADTARQNCEKRIQKFRSSVNDFLSNTSRDGAPLAHELVHSSHVIISTGIKLGNIKPSVKFSLLRLLRSSVFLTYKSKNSDLVNFHQEVKILLSDIFGKGWFNDPMLQITENKGVIAGQSITSFYEIHSDIPTFNSKVFGAIGDITENMGPFTVLKKNRYSNEDSLVAAIASFELHTLSREIGVTADMSLSEFFGKSAFLNSLPGSERERLQICKNDTEIVCLNDGDIMLSNNFFPHGKSMSAGGKENRRMYYHPLPYYREKEYEQL